MLVQLSSLVGGSARWANERRNADTDHEDDDGLNELEVLRRAPRELQLLPPDSSPVDLLAWLGKLVANFSEQLVLVDLVTFGALVALAHDIARSRT